MNKGLIVIDVQEGFLTESTRDAAAAILGMLESKIFNPVVFTRFKNEKGSPHQRILDWDGISTEEEFQLWSEIAGQADNVIDKKSYTAVTPELRQKFLDKNTKTIYLAGFDTDCCVLCTAADLFQIGIRPVVLADYCASGGGGESHEAGLKALSRIIGKQNIIHGLPDMEAL